MKKSDRKLLSETLDKALDPPARRKPALASRLSEYDDEQETAPKPKMMEAAPPVSRSRGVTPRNPTPPAAPERDYNKRANSLDRLALPAGLFPGSSKKLYDALYVRTRGAIVPTKNVRATKRELSAWSGIRNAKTIDAHLRYFSALGLIVSQWERGQNDGAVYEVRLPEETTGLTLSRGAVNKVAPPHPTLPHVTPLQGELPQNSGLPHDQNLGSPHPTQDTIISTTSGEPKTSFKTNTIDDDECIALSDLHSILAAAAQKLTGRAPKATEREQWAELACVIVAELNEAAARAGSVSSVPAFLSEHLRRKFAQRATERKREGKHAAPVEQASEIPAPRPAQELRLKPEEITEQARLIAELLESGYTIEQAEAQFSGGLHPDDWIAVRDAALTEKRSNGGTESK